MPIWFFLLFHYLWTFYHYRIWFGMFFLESITSRSTLPNWRQVSRPVDSYHLKPGRGILSLKVLNAPVLFLKDYEISQDVFHKKILMLVVVSEVLIAHAENLLILAFCSFYRFVFLFQVFFNFILSDSQKLGSGIYLPCFLGLKPTQKMGFKA